MRNKPMLIASLALAAAVFGGCSTSTPAKAPEYRSPYQKEQDRKAVEKFQRDYEREFGPDSDYPESDRYDQDPYEGCQYVVSC
jgi:hypothetical protein